MRKPISDGMVRGSVTGILLAGIFSSLLFIGRSSGAVLAILLVSLFAGMALNITRGATSTATPNTLSPTPDTVWWRQPVWIAFWILVFVAVSRRSGH